MWDLVPWPGIKLHPLRWKPIVRATGPPVKSQAFIKDCRGARSHSIYALQKDRLHCCFIGLSLAGGEGMVVRGEGARRELLLVRRRRVAPGTHARRRSARRRVCTRPVHHRHLELRCHEHSPAELCPTQPFCTWNTGLKRDSACSTRWASETRGSTKKKQKVRPYYPGSILFPENC